MVVCEINKLLCNECIFLMRKNIECQDPGDLRTRMDEGQKWVQEHFAP